MHTSEQNHSKKEAIPGSPGPSSCVHGISCPSELSPVPSSHHFIGDHHCSSDRSSAKPSGHERASSLRYLPKQQSNAEPVSVVLIDRKNFKCQDCNEVPALGMCSRNGSGMHGELFGASMRTGHASQSLSLFLNGPDMPGVRETPSTECLRARVQPLTEQKADPEVTCCMQQQS